jgi:hypothetical protein
MNERCKQVEEALDQAADGGLPGDLAAHAAACDLCRDRVAIDRAIREGLREVPGPDASTRRALAARILRAPAAAPVTAASGRSQPHVIRWSWATAAAVAAAIAAVLIALMAVKPQPRQPIRPTAVFADLLGPLPEMAKSAKPASGQETEAAAPLGSVLALFSNGWEGPIALGRAALEAPLATGLVDESKPAGTNSPSRD